MTRGKRKTTNHAQIIKICTKSNCYQSSAKRKVMLHALRTLIKAHDEKKMAQNLHSKLEED